MEPPNKRHAHWELAILSLVRFVLYIAGLYSDGQPLEVPLYAFTYAPYYKSKKLILYLQFSSHAHIIFIIMTVINDNFQEEDDVIGCRTDNGQVTVMDAWNPIRRYAANVVDDSQDDICTHFTMVSDGRISCTLVACGRNMLQFVICP